MVLIPEACVGDVRILIRCVVSAMPESARWLLSHGKAHQAKLVLYKTAKYNNRLQNSHVIHQLGDVTVKQARLLELFKRGRFAKTTVALWTVW